LAFIFFFILKIAFNKMKTFSLLFNSNYILRIDFYDLIICERLKKIINNSALLEFFDIYSVYLFLFWLKLENVFTSRLKLCVFIIKVLFISLNAIFVCNLLHMLIVTLIQAYSGVKIYFPRDLIAFKPVVVI